MRDIEKLNDPIFQIRPIGVNSEQTSFMKQDDIRIFVLSGRDYRTDVNIRNETFTGKQIRRMLWLKNNYQRITGFTGSLTSYDKLMGELQEKHFDL